MFEQINSSEDENEMKARKIQFGVDARISLYIHEPHCYLFSVLFDDDGDDDAMKHAILSFLLCYLFPSLLFFEFLTSAQQRKRLFLLSEITQKNALDTAQRTTNCTIIFLRCLSCGKSLACDSFPFLPADEISVREGREEREREKEINFYPLNVLSFRFFLLFFSLQIKLTGMTA